jgi:hypothetical protein
VPIAGYRHYPDSWRRLDITPGAALRLVREPDNRHDALAVQIWLGDLMLGYVPKANNVDVAWALDGGMAVKAVFAGMQEQGQPVVQIILP